MFQQPTLVSATYIRQYYIILGVLVSTSPREEKLTLLTVQGGLFCVLNELVGQLE